MVVAYQSDDAGPRGLAWPSAGRAWWIVACVVIAAFLCTMDRLVLNLLVGPIKADLGISETQFSLLQGLSFTVINSVAALPLGLLVDKTSRRNLMIFGIFVWSIATAMGGLSSGFGQFLTARVFVGMGEAALWPVVVSMIADVLPPHQRGRAIGFVLLGQILGSGASLILTGLVLRIAPSGFFDFVPLLRHLPPWRLVLVLWGTLGAIVIAMLLTAREPLRRASPQVMRDGVIRSGGLRDFFARVWLLRGIMIPAYIGAMGIAIGSYGLAAWAPSFFIRRFSLAPSDIGPTLGIVGICAGIVGTSLAGFLADKAEKRSRLDLKYIILMCASLACLPGATLVFAPNASVAVAIQALSLVFFPIAGTVSIVAMQDLVPNEMRGKAQAVLTLFSSMLGATLGPTLTALATQYLYHDDMLVGYSLLTVLVPSMLISAVCFYTAAYNSRRHATLINSAR
jgi:MFS family permease